MSHTMLRQFIVKVCDAHCAYKVTFPYIFYFKLEDYLLEILY